MFIAEIVLFVRSICVKIVQYDIIDSYNIPYNKSTSGKQTDEITTP